MENGGRGMKGERNSGSQSRYYNGLSWRSLCDGAAQHRTMWRLKPGYVHTPLTPPNSSKEYGLTVVHDAVKKSKRLNAKQRAKVFKEDQTDNRMGAQSCPTHAKALVQGPHALGT